MLKYVLASVAPAFVAVSAFAGPFTGSTADVFVLGEVHDNPTHHQAQAQAIADIAPRAVVFEMLTSAQAEAYDPALSGDAKALEDALGWADTGWPDFEIYAPIFQALGNARVYGAAVPRDQARAAFELGIPESFGPEAESFGLTDDLPEPQFKARMDMQDEAHCGKMPTEMLPIMIDLQRLRDATLARATLNALADTGGPVAVITGNGHARGDWGVPSYIARIAPRVAIKTLGQSEDGQAPDGGFDVVLDAPSVDRDDPCLAFD